MGLNLPPSLAYTLRPIIVVGGIVILYIGCPVDLVLYL